MGSSRSRKKNKFRDINLISKGREFSHLVPRDEITFRKDSDFDIPEIEININGYFPSRVRLWPENRGIEATTPHVSIDSGIDFAP